MRRDDRFDADTSPRQGWTAALLESLRISPQEYGAFTGVYPPGVDPVPTLPVFFGEDRGLNTTQLDETLRNARKLARTFGISYEDLTALLRTTFINPGAVLIPKLEALAFDPEAPDNPAKGITLEILRQFYSGALTAQDLVAKVPNHIILNARDYGGDVAGWLTTNRAQITGLILLTLIPGASVNEFASYDLRYADGRNLQSADYVRLYRFVRLREKLGWTIEDTDLALRALFPKMPENPDNGFREFCPD